MSLPNPINVTYVSPLISDTFPFQYIVKDTDNIINIDTTNGAVHVILRNIRNSGILQYQPLLSINDGGNNASVNNITIYPSGGDIINDSASFVINTDGGNSVLNISNINQWLTTSSQPSGGGGTPFDGLSYTYVYGNGADALENGQQLLDGYEEAKAKRIEINPIINYGALDIVSIDEYYWQSEAINTSLLEPYYSENLLSSGFTLILNGVSYNNIYIGYNLDSNEVFEGNPSNPYPALGSYESALITDFDITFKKSILIVGAGYYETNTTFIINESDVDVVSLTGNPDVFLSNSTNNNGVIIGVDNIYVRGINTGENQIYIGASFPNLIVENCRGGDGSFGWEGSPSGTFINCQGGYNSFGGGGGTASGTFINCQGGDGSFGGNGGTASGTFTNCQGTIGSFGGDDYILGVGGIASGTFNLCQGDDYSFGGGVDGTASGTFINCRGGLGLFGGGGTASGNFNECKGGEASFGADETASGTFTNCVGGDYSFGGGGVAIASGTFINCQGGDSSFGGTSFGSSGIFINCQSGSSSFSGNASGTFTNCVGGNSSFGGNLTASGVFTNCVGGNSSFGGTTGTLSGKLYYCRITSGTFKTVSGGGVTRLCFGSNNVVNNQG